MLVLTRKDVEELLDLDAVVDALADAFVDLSEGRASMPQRVASFSAVEDRLHHDTAERLTALERSIEQEWAGLRRLHETPVRALQEQATTLAQVSIAASNSGVTRDDC